MIYTIKHSTVVPVTVYYHGAGVVPTRGTKYTTVRAIGGIGACLGVQYGIAHIYGIDRIVVRKINGVNFAQWEVLQHIAPLSARIGVPVSNVA